MTKKNPQMVDISLKSITRRKAIAIGTLRLKKETIDRVKNGNIEKGDALTVAKIAGIMAAKNTSNILPLCHPIPISSVDVVDEIGENDVLFKVTVVAESKTGVEMEALTAVTVALLTLWDMVKQYEKDEEGQYPTTTINSIRVVQKIKKN
ncbi:MAG: cyclic pyranopterin monophosphate synthase MoaC [Candidatus Bathyarchaeota archaeon]|nr:MAG: cyclic pyranopterin monophosphate synthase MoaC [Candidatus Bathyarchaeota archaeon]